MSDDLKADCAALRKAALGGVAWVNDAANSDIVGLERSSVDKRLRRLVTEATRLEEAVEKPSCVGVFGPSQAGKSYLVSVLARAGEDPLLVKFPGETEPVDYISRINPDGGRESTGVVTRFSIHEQPAPDGYPVRLRLLTETDIAKVLVNTFFNEIDQKEMPELDPAEVDNLLEHARSLSSSSKPSDNALEREDIWDVQGYFEALFETTVRKDRLALYWDEAATLAPMLPLSERARLLAPIWGGLDPLTTLYEELVGALARLDFATYAHCGMEALIPKADSIVDVRTLETHLGRSDQPSLRVKVEQGPECELPLGIVTALTAELRLTIAEKPWSFFETTDLLDFPGARSRQPKAPEERFLPAGDVKNPLAELLVRGKVAYLFDRYREDQELTALLLCIPHGPLEVIDLPPLIARWIDVTHGATPEERSGRPVTLFFVMTMFDMLFSDKAGERDADPGDRFAARMQASLFDRFDASWYANWTPATPFKNAFWLRNPTVPAHSIIEYDEGREVGFREGRESYVDTLRAGSLTVPAVQAHFADPGAAFDAAMSFNDGGVSYLAERLEPVCRPELKQAQIAARRDALATQARHVLSPYHVANDVDARLEERRGVAQRIMAHLQKLYQEQRFTQVLAAQQISQHRLASVLREALLRGPGESASKDDPPSAPRAAPELPPLPGAQGLPPLPGAPPPPAAAKDAEDKPAPLRPVHSEHLHLARAAVSTWLSSIRASAENGRLSSLFRDDPELASELVTEIGQAARRRALEEEIAHAIGDVSAGAGEPKDVLLEKAVLVAGHRIDDFVAHFYIDALSAEERPEVPSVDGTTSPAFLRRRPVADNSRTMEIAPFDQRQAWAYDWLYTFYRVVEDNAKSVEGLDIDIEQNARLGGFLAALAGSGAGAHAAP